MKMTKEEKHLFSRNTEEVKQRGQEATLQWIIAIFVVLFFLGVNPYTVIKLTYNLWIVAAFVFLIIGISLLSLRPALQILSPGYQDEIHHNSLDTNGPWSIVPLYLSNGDVINLAIFPLGGVDVSFVKIKGGGRHGYVLVPEGGYIQEGPNVTVIYGVKKYAYAVVPKAARERLKGHRRFRVRSSPIWIAWLPPLSSTLAKAMSLYDPAAASKAMGDLVEYNKTVEQNYAHSDVTRNVEVRRHMDVLKRRSSKEDEGVDEEDNSLQ